MSVGLDRLPCLLFAALSIMVHLTGSLGAAKRESTDVTQAFKIEREETPIILVRATVNGCGPYMFGVDTGASLTTISSQLARHLRIKARVQEKGTATDGRFTFWIGELSSIAVGSAQACSLPVAIMNLKDLSHTAGEHLDGLIGYNFLKFFQVRIDFPKQRISLRRTGPGGAESEGVKCPDLSGR